MSKLLKVTIFHDIAWLRYKLQEAIPAYWSVKIGPMKIRFFVAFWFQSIVVVGSKSTTFNSFMDYDSPMAYVKS